MNIDSDSKLHLKTEGQSRSIAYIDGANLHKSISDLGWVLDYRRFRAWIRQKYNVQIAYIFIGMVERYSNLYLFLRKAEFTLVFKEVVFDGTGKAKGNCDADLVLRAVRDHFEEKVDRVLLISSDGDYVLL